MKKSVLLMPILVAFSIGIFSCDDVGVKSVTHITSSLMLNDSSGTNAYITNLSPNVNFKKDPDFAGVAWTDSRNYKCVGRTLFKFYLNNIPTATTVNSATLYLYYNPAPIHSGGTGHNSDSGSNSCYLQRITSPWDDSTVTWANQPTTTAQNEVILPQSSSFDQNYVIDVTSLINDMIKNPSSNYGLMMLLETELPIRSLNFQSIKASYSFRPRLEVTYTQE